MMQNVTPAWLNEDVESSSQSAPLTRNNQTSNSNISSSSLGSSNIAGASMPTTPKTADTLRNAKYLHYGLKIITMALCMLMSATAIVGLGSITGVDKTGKLFVASYMFFFSCLLFSFEIVQVLPPSKITEKLDHMFRRNFGFLYNCMGKSFFIIFMSYTYHTYRITSIAFLSFGLGEPVNLSMATGLSFAGYGAFTLSLYLKYPEMFE